MNCREFRRKHDAYVDDTLSGIDLEAMGQHLRVCVPCAAQDTRIRRSLLLARNLPMIQLSDSFSERMERRLAEERAMRGSRSVGITQDMMGRDRSVFTAGTFMTLAAGLAMAAGAMLMVVRSGGSDSAIRLAPVVASLPEPEPSLMATPAMVASMPAGLPIWPAMFVAQQAPWHFANDDGSR